MIAVQNFFDRNHNLFIRFGGLFAVIFLVVYVPASIYLNDQEKLNEQIQINARLMEEMTYMKNETEFFEMHYGKQQALMREVDCLAKNIYFEAKSEPYTGKVAVAEVTVNRVKSSDYPKSVCGVVYQRNNGVCQFSWVCEAYRKIDANNKDWLDAVRISQRMLLMKRESNIVAGAKFFHATYVQPSWSKTKTLVKQIGNHLFYRN